MVRRNMPDTASPPPTRAVERRPLPPEVALVLPGGGALGSYQAGAYEALSSAKVPIDCVLGVSIGAVNGAIIAGNPPADRLVKLRRFWEKVSSGSVSAPVPNVGNLREIAHVASAFYASAFGVPGFFSPRPSLMAGGDNGSWYDTGPLRKTLDELVDWDLLNSGKVRLVVSAVNVESGELHYFDTRETRLDARHIMASGALPPGLPPVRIDGQSWWDGALVSNTPLMHILGDETDDVLIIQIDLFASKGEPPKSVLEAVSREKEIRFSSQNEDLAQRMRETDEKRQLLRRALAKLPRELRKDRDFAELRKLATEHKVSMVQLIHHRSRWETWARDFEFSRQSMENSWRAGHEAMARRLRRGRLTARDFLTGEEVFVETGGRKED
jgi:NTE family protein